MWKFKNLVYARGNSYNLSVQGFINPFQKRFWQINGKIRWLRNHFGHSTHAARCCVPSRNLGNGWGAENFTRGEKNRQRLDEENFARNEEKVREKTIQKTTKSLKRKCGSRRKYLIPQLSKGSSSPQWKSLDNSFTGSPKSFLKECLFERNFLQRGVHSKIWSKRLLHL